MTTRSDDTMLTMLHLLWLANDIWRSISLRKASLPRMIGPPGTHSCHSASSAIMASIFSTCGLDSAVPSPQISQNSRINSSCTWPIKFSPLLVAVPTSDLTECDWNAVQHCVTRGCIDEQPRAQ